MRKLLLLLLLSSSLFAQVSPQIQGAGAPSNPCYNGGQQYIDQTNHVIYACPSSGANWVNLGGGNMPQANIRSLSSDPATCSTVDINAANNIYYNTTSAVYKYCSATNTWTAFGTGSGSGTVTSSGSPVSGNIPKFTTATNIAPAAASDIVNLFSTCSGTQSLGADGACHSAGSGTVTNTGGSLTSNAVVLGAGTNDTKVSTGFTTDGSKELDLGTATSTSGVLGLNGSTSGKATFTAPAVAGTSTNAVVSSNVFQVPAGAVGTPGIAIGAATVGFYEVAGPVIRVTNGGDIVGFYQTSSQPQIFTTSAGVFEWTSGAMSAGGDTGLSRIAAAVVGVGNSTQGDTSGKVKAAGYMSVGTTFTSSGGCTEGTLIGGATAGRFTTSGSTSCTTVITMGNSATAPNGWQCSATDITTSGDAANPHMTTSNGTTATLATGTIVSGDVISFACIGY